MIEGFGHEKTSCIFLTHMIYYLLHEFQTIHANIAHHFGYAQTDRRERAAGGERPH